MKRKTDIQESKKRGVLIKINVSLSRYLLLDTNYDTCALFFSFLFFLFFW